MKFLRHGKTQASLALLIWLKRNFLRIYLNFHSEINLERKKYVRVCQIENRVA